MCVSATCKQTCPRFKINSPCLFSMGAVTGDFSVCSQQYLIVYQVSPDVITWKYFSVVQITSSITYTSNFTRKFGKVNYIARGVLCPGLSLSLSLSLSFSLSLYIYVVIVDDRSRG